MITLQELSWDNCFSYGQGNKIDFLDARLTQILGTNGAGKSSIPLILEECLYNRNSKDVKKADIQNRKSKSGYKIRVVFTKFSDTYEVIVERKTNIKVWLIKNGEDISSHTALNTYKTIEEIIGMDFKTFSQLIYQSRNSSLQFLTATDTVRKKFLIDLLNLEEYNQIFELFKEESKTLTTKIGKVESQLEIVFSWLNSKAKINLERVSVPEVLEFNYALEQAVAALQQELTNADSTNAKIIKNNDLKELLKEVDIEKLTTTSKTIELEPTDQINAKLGAANSEYTRLKASIKELNSIPDNCPTCGQPIDNSTNKLLLNEAKSKLAKVEEDRAELAQQLAEIEIRNNNKKSEQKQIEKWQSIYRSIDHSLPTEIIDIKEKREEVKRQAIKLKDHKKDVEQSKVDREQAIVHNSIVENLSKEIAVQKELEQELSKELEVLKSKFADVEVLKKAMSTNGLVAYKIEGSVKELEAITNEYLAELSDGRFTITFSINNDKLNIEITDNGESIDINSLSTGEQSRVNISTLLAIRKVMTSLSKVNINVLFLDEVIGVLDDLGKEKLVEQLLQEEELNTYIVSHNWEHPLLAKLSVSKVDDISRIE